MSVNSRNIRIFNRLNVVFIYSNFDLLFFIKASLLRPNFRESLSIWLEVILLFLIVCTSFLRFTINTSSMPLIMIFSRDFFFQMDLQVSYDGLERTQETTNFAKVGEKRNCWSCFAVSNCQTLQRKYPSALPPYSFNTQRSHCIL